MTYKPRDPSSESSASGLEQEDAKLPGEAHDASSGRGDAQGGSVQGGVGDAASLGTPGGGEDGAAKPGEQGDEIQDEAAAAAP